MRSIREKSCVELMEDIRTKSGSAHRAQDKTALQNYLCTAVVRHIDLKSLSFFSMTG